jgi:RNA polymerase sigma-70 factor (ECF subfamily)
MDVPDSVIEACKRGDADAFERLVQLTQKDVYSLAYRMMGNPDDAAEASQDTYLKLLRVIRSFRGDAKFSTWLYRVTSNVCLTTLRKRSRRAQEVALDSEDWTEVASEAEGPQEQAERAWDKQRVERALTQISENYRVVVVMKDIYGFPISHIAKELKVSESAVKVRLFRARRRLKDILTEPSTEKNDGTQAS